jgi:peptidoglycan hydrolase CwlO-like protein
MIVNLGKNKSHMKKTLFIFIAAFICITASAQLQKDSIKADPTLNGQYQLLLSKSRTMDGYKLMNPARLSLFWKNVRDTLNIAHKQLINTKKEAANYQNEIKELNKQVAGAETSLASSNARLNEIGFLGISFTKSSYNIFVWGLIAALAVTLTIVILRSARNIHEAKYRSTLYEEINKEYQNYKVKANEKEKKLARALQDERNKLDEIRSNGR